MAGEIIRLGIIYPPGYGEQEYYQMAEKLGERFRVYLVVHKWVGWGHIIDDLLEVGDVDELAATAGKLLSLKPNSAVWACTSASFIGGASLAESQAKAISEAAGCPASSTSLAFVRAVKALDLKRVSIMAISYPREVATRLEAFLKEYDIEVCRLLSMEDVSGIEEGWKLPSSELMKAVREADSKEAEAIFIPDTAIPTMEIIQPLEEALGKPILTANQVTFWNLLRQANVEDNLPAFGKLFER